MKAIRLHGARDIRVDEVPDPGPPGPGDVTVAVRRLGICGSDVHYYQDMRIGDQVVNPPMTLGHEFMGTIAALGEGVTGLSVGQRVTVEPGVPCEKCEPCLLGRPNVCANVRFAGSAPGQVGAGCEHWNHPAKWCFPLPDEVSDDAGALIEPFGVGLHAVKLVGFQTGQTAAITGAGTIGLSILAALKALGASAVYVSEPIAARREAALRMGATGVLDPQEDDVGTRIWELTNGGVDVAFEAAGQPDAINDAMRAAKRCGALNIVGICATDTVGLLLHEARRRELVIHNSRRSAHVIELAIEMLARGNADLAPIATHQFPMAEAPRAFEMADTREDGLIKALIRIPE